MDAGVRLAAADRREQLVGAFIDEALSVGSIAGVGVRAVLARAGCTAPVLYRLFGDRRGLVLEAVRSTHASLLESLECVVKSEDGSPATRLRALAEDYLARAPGRGDSFEALVNVECGSDSELAAEVHKVYTHFERQLVQALKSGIETGDFAADLDPVFVAWRFIELGLFRNQAHLMKLGRPRKIRYMRRSLDNLFAEIES